MVQRFPNKKKIFSRLPHFLQLSLAKTYCERKKKWARHLDTPVTLNLKTCLSVQRKNISELEDYVEYLLPLRIPLRFNIVRGGDFGVFNLPRGASASFDPKDKMSSFLSLEEIKHAYSLLKKLSDENEFHFGLCGSSEYGSCPSRC